jgi:hypothetical protein
MYVIMYYIVPGYICMTELYIVSELTNFKHLNSEQMYALQSVIRNGGSV